MQCISKYITQIYLKRYRAEDFFEFMSIIGSYQNALTDISVTNCDKHLYFFHDNGVIK